MKLSIIIPIYNVERFLPACLDSIFSQGIDESEYEVICVNDGSPDNSASVVAGYALNHNNLVYIAQENQGVSVARNKGMSVAKGEWIMFADPDDIIQPNALKQVVDALEFDADADFVICKTKNHVLYNWSGRFEDQKTYNSADILNKGFLYGSVWGGYFRRSFLEENNVKFIPNIRNGEDTNFVMQVLYNTNRTKFREIDLYEVVGHEGSASRLYTQKRIDSMIDSVKKVSACRTTLAKKEGNKEVLDYMMYTALLNLVKDTSHTKGVGYSYLKKHGVDKYCKFEISPNSLFLRSKMNLINKSFFVFYFVRYLMVMFTGRA